MFFLKQGLFFFLFSKQEETLLKFLSYFFIFPLFEGKVCFLIFLLFSLYWRGKGKGRGWGKVYERGWEGVYDHKTGVEKALYIKGFRHSGRIFDTVLIPNRIINNGRNEFLPLFFICRCRFVGILFLMFTHFLKKYAII